MNTGHFSIDDKIYLTHQMPAVLIELANRQGIASAPLLRGTGIFSEDINNIHHKISSRRWQRLLDNAAKQDKSHELLLRFGRQLPYITHSSLLQALLNAEGTRNLLEILKDYSQLYYPHVYFHLASNNDFHFFLFNNAVSHENAHLHHHILMSSVSMLFKACDITKTGITFLLNTSAPSDSAALQTYLGSRIYYNAPVNAMLISDADKQPSLARSCNTTKQQALIECRRKIDKETLKKGFLESLHSYLIQRITREDTGLNSCAESFQVSPATFKRRLKCHDSSFQYELDNTRKLLALSMLLIQGMSSEETARQLRISDNANFRRSFKRWTGILPSAAKDQLLHF